MSIETSRKILKVFGIFSIILGIFGIIFGIAAISGGSMMGFEVATQKIEGGVATGLAIGFLGFGGLFFIFAGAITIVEGCFAVRASKDFSKIMPAWIFALIGLILSAVNTISNIQALTVQTKVDFSSIVGIISGIAINILIFIAANNIKNEVGK